MIMTRVDWNRVGFAAGSKTDALDWNDWKRPLISRLKAKLLRKRTYDVSENYPLFDDGQHTRLDIAVLNRTRSISSCGDLSTLSTPKIYPKNQSGRARRDCPTFEVECHDECVIGWRHGHPYAL